MTHPEVIAALADGHAVEFLPLKREKLAPAGYSEPDALVDTHHATHGRHVERVINLTCQRCGQPGSGYVLELHWHGHCTTCGLDVAPCCQPDAWDDDATRALR